MKFEELPMQEDLVLRYEVLFFSATAFARRGVLGTVTVFYRNSGWLQKCPFALRFRANNMANDAELIEAVTEIIDELRHMLDKELFALHELYAIAALHDIGPNPNTVPAQIVLRATNSESYAYY